MYELADITPIAYMVLIVFLVPLYLKLERSGSNDSLYREFHLSAASVMIPVLSTGINMGICLFL